ncbi:MAG: HlyD family efflux transporter periplasmic adaptor subunit [Planctomycetales bacterium]
MQSDRSAAMEAVRILVPVIVLAVAYLGYQALGGKPKINAKEPGLDEDRAALVETVPVARHQGGLIIEADGSAVPYRMIDAAARISGAVVRKTEICRAGNYVEAGTPLLEIDPQDYELEVERLTTERAQAAANLEELDVQLVNNEELLKLADEDASLMRKHLLRATQLFEKKLTPDSELDSAKRAELGSRNSRRMLRNQTLLLKTRRRRLEQARDLVGVQLRKAELDLSRTKITAPISGVLSREHVELESFVQKGTMLFSMTDVSRIEIQCNLRVKDLAWLWQGKGTSENEQDSGAGYQLPRAPVEVSYRLAGRECVWQGELSRFEGIGMDDKTRTVPCRVVVKKPAGARWSDDDSGASSEATPVLMRGMYVTVRIQAKPDVEFLRVPERAVRPGNVVWWVQDGHLKIERVPFVERDGDVVLVRADKVSFTADDQVVVSATSALQSGVRVREQATK